MKVKHMIIKIYMDLGSAQLPSTSRQKRVRLGRVVQSQGIFTIIDKMGTHVCFPGVKSVAGSAKLATVPVHFMLNHCRTL